MASKYEQSGVNIEEGYRAVSKMKASAAKTTIPGVLGGLGSFASMFRLGDYKQYKDPVLISGTDGVGTKLKLAFALNRYDTIGIDAVAMCVNDVLCHGGEPLFFLDYIACGKLDADVAAAIVSGVAEGCLQAGCALVGGETAEMPGIYQDGEYDIAGFVVAAAEREAIIDGSKIRPGDALLGLRSSGFHSNGFSLINWLVKDFTVPFSSVYGGEIPPEYQGKTLGEVLLTPTKIYVKAVLQLINELEIHGLAHITGGGFPENLPRMFSQPMTAQITKDSLDNPAPFQYIQQLGKIPQEEMYSTFNMGYGMVAALPKEQLTQAVSLLKSEGISAHQIGQVTDFSGEALCFQ